MPTYVYSARDQRGQVQVGHLDALEEDEVVAILQRRGLLVTAISQKTVTETRTISKEVVQRPGVRQMHGRVTVNDQVVLCQQLGTLVEAGVPLLRALQVVSSQVTSRSLFLALEEIRRDVEAGRTLRDGLIKHPAIFSRMWGNLVETGEASGHLPTAFQQLSRHLEAEQHLQNEVKTALTYPLFLIVTAACVLAVFVYWLIPKFEVMFASMGMDLPPITRVMIALSVFARKYVVALFFAAVAAGYLLRHYLRTDAGAWACDRLVLHLPVFKGLFQHVQLAQFSRGLATLLESGVPLLSGLEILQNSMTNKVYGAAVSVIRESVKEGKTMAEPMGQTGMFPPMAVQMVQVGEEVGELAKMANRIATFYEEQVSIFIARMSRLFEPIGIIVMAVMVFFIVASIFMPIFKMATGSVNVH